MTLAERPPGSVGVEARTPNKAPRRSCLRAVASTVLVCLCAVLPPAIPPLVAAVLGLWVPVGILWETFGVHYTAYPTFALGYHLVGNAMAFDVVYAYLPSYVTHELLGRFREFDRFQWWWYGVFAIHCALLLAVALWLSSRPLSLISRLCVVLVAGSLPLFVGSRYVDFLTPNYHLLEAVLYAIGAGLWVQALRGRSRPGLLLAAVVGIVLALATWTKFTLAITIGSFFLALLVAGGWPGLWRRAGVCAGSFGLATLVLAWVYFVGHLEYVPRFVADLQVMYSADFLNQHTPYLRPEVTTWLGFASAFQAATALAIVATLGGIVWAIVCPTAARWLFVASALGVGGFFVPFMLHRVAANSFVDAVLFSSFIISVWVGAGAASQRGRWLVAPLLAAYLLLAGHTTWVVLANGRPDQFVLGFQLAGAAARAIDDDIYRRPSLSIVYYWSGDGGGPIWNGPVEANFPSPYLWELLSAAQDTKRMYFDRYSPRSSHRAVVDGVAPGPHIMVVPEHVLPGYAPGMKPRPTEAVVFGRYPAFDEVLADPRSDCVQHGPPRSLGAVQDVEVRPVTVCTVQAGSPVQPGQPDSAPPAGTVNLALHAPVRAGGGPTATLPALATDGDVDDDGSGRSVASVDRTWQPWLEVDLGAVHDVTAITIWPRRGECCRERLRGIYVFTTADPIRTDDPVSIRQVAGISSAFLDGMVSVPTRVDVGQRARYVRLQGLDTNYLEVAEVQVWGPSGP